MKYQQSGIFLTKIVMDLSRIRLWKAQALTFGGMATIEAQWGKTMTIITTKHSYFGDNELPPDCKLYWTSWYYGCVNVVAVGMKVNGLVIKGWGNGVCCERVSTSQVHSLPTCNFTGIKKLKKCRWHMVEANQGQKMGIAIKRTKIHE